MCPVLIIIFLAFPGLFFKRVDTCMRLPIAFGLPRLEKYIFIYENACLRDANAERTVQCKTVIQRLHFTGTMPLFLHEKKNVYT